MVVVISVKVSDLVLFQHYTYVFQYKAHFDSVISVHSLIKGVNFITTSEVFVPLVSISQD